MIDVAERAISVFGELHDELGLARSWRLAAQAHYLGRRAGTCAEVSERALKHARAARNRFEQREIVEWLVIALLLGPQPAGEAAARCRKLSKELTSQPLLQAEVLAAWATLEAMLGRTSEAAELNGRVQEATEAYNTSIFLVPLWRGFTLLWLDDADGAERELVPAYNRLKQLGERSHFSSIAQALSQAVYNQGRYAEAEQLTHECEQVARPNDVHTHIGWRTIRAMALARRGADDEAEALARDAVAYAETSDFLPSHAEATLGLAEVLELRGRRSEALDAIRLALDLHERKGNVLAANRARTALRQNPGSD
jgi:tetratricopeptide (TPR) repeat protein